MISLKLKYLVVLLLLQYSAHDVETARPYLEDEQRSNDNFASYDLVPKHEDAVIYLIKGLQNILDYWNMGPYVDAPFQSLLAFIRIIENETNNLFDKIIRRTLPCTIHINGFICEGAVKYKGISSIIEKSVKEIPDTIFFFVVKKLILEAIRNSSMIG